jgi:hypothetical protein
VRIGRWGLFKRELKCFVIAGAPGDFNAGPLLCYSPILFQEEMGSVNDFVLSQKIFVGNPLNVVSLNTSLSIRNWSGENLLEHVWWVETAAVHFLDVALELDRCLCS